MPADARERSAKYRLANVLLGGGTALDDFIAERRADDRSWRTIANELRDQVDVDITPETLRSWYPDPSDDVDAQPAEATS